LTDNGLEFTNGLLVSKKGKHCQKLTKVDEVCERANGIIKQDTVLKEHYADAVDMKAALMRFLAFYRLYRRHGSLKRELGIRTPFDAIEKCLPRSKAYRG